MTESNEAFDHPIPYDEHPLYDEAMQQLASDDEAGAVASLQRLAELYPNQKDIQGLLVRLQLRTTFGSADYIQVERPQAAPILRSIVLLMLGITACLVMAAGLAAAYNRLWVPTARARQQEETINSLWQDVDRRIDAGDLIGARQLLETLAAQTPDDPKIQDTLQELARQQAWADLYAEAVDRRENGEWQIALDLAYQIPAESPDYNRAQQLIQELQGLAALETAWQDVQGFLQSEDWQSAVSTLAWIRTQNPGFRRADVENLLYQLHTQLARQLLSQANGQVDLVRQATGHLSEALTLRPTDQSLIEEKRLAVGFVAGSEAYDRGDWVAVVTRWEPVYMAQPNYQGGMLKQRLDDAYPRAAQQLISQANGSPRLLRQAVGYLDQALRSQPDDPILLEERRLATEYLAGQEAFAAEKWDLAIQYWAPIYAIRPDYQNGKLKENLSLACANSEEPDGAVCPPR